MTSSRDPVPARVPPLVSARIVVAVPLYNEDRFVEETLNSLARQSCFDFNVIIADNASTDRSGEICARIASTDSRFTYVRHPSNLGAARNFEFCVGSSESEYFMWCGAHDVLSENFISTMVAALDAFPKTSIAFGVRSGIDELSNHIEAIDQDHSYIYRFAHTRLARYIQAACGLSDCTIVNGMFRRRDLHGFDFRAVKSLDMVLLAHLLYQGELQYRPDAIYFRRYFSSRPESQGRRIAGGSTPADMSNRSLSQYFSDDISALSGSTRTRAERFGLLVAKVAVRLRYSYFVGRLIRFLVRMQIQPNRHLRQQTSRRAA